MEPHQSLPPACQNLVRSSFQESCSKSRAQGRMETTSRRPRNRASPLALHHHLMPSTAHLHQEPSCPADMATSSLTTGGLSQASTLLEPTLKPALVLIQAVITGTQTTTSDTTIPTAQLRSSRCSPSPVTLSRASRPQDLDTSKGLALTWRKEEHIISSQILQQWFS